MRKIPLLFLRRRRGREGQTLVEFTFVAPVFLLLVFGVVEYAQVFFFESSVLHALREAGRVATPGLVESNAPPSGTNYTRENSIKRKFYDRLTIGSNFVKSLTIQSWPGNSGATSGSPNNGPGIQEDFVRIKTEVWLPFITPLTSMLHGGNGKMGRSLETDPVTGKQTWGYKMTLEGVFRNEPSKNFVNNP